MNIGTEFKRSRWVLILGNHWWLLKIKSHGSCETRNNSEEVKEWRKLERGIEHRKKQHTKFQKEWNRNVQWMQGTERNGMVVWMSSGDQPVMSGARGTCELHCSQISWWIWGVFWAQRLAVCWNVTDWSWGEWQEVFSWLHLVVKEN